jgi:hypothetical protein
MDETEELIGLCVRALVAQMHAAPGFELHMTRNCVLGLTDVPLADFNMLILGPDPDAEGFITRSVARAKARGLPLTAMMSPHVAPALAPVAMRLGLTAASASPLMLLRAETPVLPGRPVKIVRALGPELVGVAVARCIDVGITETAGVETYIAWGDDGPVSAVSVTPTGNTAGISLMATAPGRQRQGMGRALLSHLIAAYRRRGVDRFHLGATEAGRPLYASLGFEAVAELSVWALAHTTEVDAFTLTPHRHR